MKRIIAIMSLLLLASGLYAAGRIKVVASIAPLMNIASAIGGEKADFQCIVPPGASPHTFSPKPSQIRALADADVFIRVGAGFEFWAPKMLIASGNKKLKVVTITDGISLIAADEHGGAGHAGHSNSGNPHVWLDPVLVKSIAASICEAYIAISPKDAKYFRKNLKIFTEQLSRLDAYFKAETDKFSTKEIVSFHPAWVYFEKRYGLIEAGVIQATPGREATPKELSAIIKQIKKYGIKTIFAEPQLPRKAADVIAREARVKVLIIDPNGQLDGDYIGFMKRNFEVIKEGMK